MRIRGHAEIGRERRRTYEAARALHGINPTDLVRLAEMRAGRGEVRDIDRRDFVRELREEISDARNYLVWFAEQLDRGAHLNIGLAGAIRPKLVVALADTAHLFAVVEEISELMRGWSRP